MRLLMVALLLVSVQSAVAQKQRFVPLPWEERQRVKSMSASEVFEYGHEKYGIYDPKKAARYYQAAIEKGSDDARAHLGDFYIRGWGVWGDRRLGLELMRTAAQSGKPHLMYLLATTITDHLQQHSKELTAEAISWLEKAGRAGYVPAMALLAETGVYNTPHSPVATYAAFIPANAFCDHAGVYTEDASAKIREAEPVRAMGRQLLSSNAQYGNIDAMAALGRILMLGLGVERDPAEAEKWLARAAELGHVLSQLRLAMLLYESPSRHGDAFQLFKSLAEDGEQLAMKHLFKMYTMGHGTEQDYSQAAYWKLREYELGCFVISSFRPEHVVAVKQIMKREGHFQGPINTERNQEFETAFGAYFGRLSKEKSSKNTR